MRRILMIGATSELGQVIRDYLLAHGNDQLTLLAPQATRLVTDGGRETVINGDPTQPADLKSALNGQDLVLAILSGATSQLTMNLINTVAQRPATRLIFVKTGHRATVNLTDYCAQCSLSTVALKRGLTAAVIDAPKLIAEFDPQMTLESANRHHLANLSVAQAVLSAVDDNQWQDTAQPA